MEASMGVFEHLTAQATPGRVAVPGRADEEQRDWVVRLTTEIPRHWDMGSMRRTLVARATTAVQQACLERGLVDVDRLAKIDVELILIDEKHLVVSVRTIALEKDEVHAWLVAGSAALRALEEVVPLDDLQGLPRRLWRLVLGP
jgi:hypothetical protein